MKKILEGFEPKRFSIIVKQSPLDGSRLKPDNRWYGLFASLQVPSVSIARRFGFGREVMLG